MVEDGSIWGDVMFDAEKFPAGVTDLYASLADVKIDDFSHCFYVYGCFGNG